MKSKIFFLILMGCLILPFAAAQNYYADIQIFVGNDGAVTLSGDTDYPVFNNINNSQIYTSKKGEMWTLNLTTQENFESYVFELNLPLNSNVNYIKTTPDFRIENDNGRIKIIGIGENKPFTLIVQYKIKPTNPFLSEKNLLLIIILVFIFSLAITIVLGFRILKKLKVNLTLKEEIEYLKKKASDLKDKKFHYIREKEKKELLAEEKKPKIDLKLFSERQQQIIRIIQNKKKITQKDLEIEMKIPKSSVSRNINTLVAKGIIEKQSIGITNYLSLKNR